MNEEFNELNDAEPKPVSVSPQNIGVGKRKIVRSSMFGVPEFIALGLGLLSLLAVGLLYLLYVSPANAEIQRHKEVSRKLSTELDDAKKKFGNISSTKERVAELVNSVDFFERNYLPIATVGKTGLYQRINALISAYGLTNTTGPDFMPLEISTIKQTQQNEKEKGRGKFQSLFPGVFVSVTVNGSYQNLRRFIRDIETTGQFVIVSTVELEAADGQSETIKPNSQPARNNQSSFERPGNPTIPEIDINDVNGGTRGKDLSGKSLVPTAPKATPVPRTVLVAGKTKGDTVSLHLEMAAYFRRNIQAENQQAIATESVQR
jgi:Tfp pilus assembly protein PilO